MIKTFIISIFLLCSFTTVEKDLGCLNIDIVLVGDFSTSVIGQEKFVGEAFTAFANQFELSEETTKIGVITFADHARRLSALTSNIDSLKIALSQMPLGSGGSTNMFEAFHLAFQEIHGPRSRNGYRKMVILVSDGYPDSPRDVLKIAEDLKNTGVVVCSILMNQVSNNPEFMRNVSNNCYVESDYRHLVDELKKLDICM